MKISATDYLANLCRIGDAIAVTDGEGCSLSLDEGLQRWFVELQAIAAARRKVIFFGNGGSAAIASHVAADWTKNLAVPTLNFADAALLTCISNDLGYPEVYAIGVRRFGAEGDLVCAISSSGESENILRGVNAARAVDARVVTLSGFADTNSLRRMGDLNFYVPSGEYGFVEILHMTLAQFIADLWMWSSR